MYVCCLYIPVASHTDGLHTCRVDQGSLNACRPRTVKESKIVVFWVT